MVAVQVNPGTTAGTPFQNQQAIGRDNDGFWYVLYLDPGSSSVYLAKSTTPAAAPVAFTSVLLMSILVPGAIFPLGSIGVPSLSEGAVLRVLNTGTPIGIAIGWMDGSGRMWFIWNDTPTGPGLGFDIATAANWTDGFGGPPGPVASSTAVLLGVPNAFDMVILQDLGGNNAQLYQVHDISGIGDGSINIWELVSMVSAPGPNLLLTWSGSIPPLTMPILSMKVRSQGPGTGSFNLVMYDSGDNVFAFNIFMSGGVAAFVIDAGGGFGIVPVGTDLFPLTPPVAISNYTGAFPVGIFPVGTNNYDMAMGPISATPATFLSTITPITFPAPNTFADILITSGAFILVGADPVYIVNVVGAPTTKVTSFENPLGATEGIVWEETTGLIKHVDYTGLPLIATQAVPPSFPDGVGLGIVTPGESIPFDTELSFVYSAADGTVWFDQFGAVAPPAPSITSITPNSIDNDHTYDGGPPPNLSKLTVAGGNFQAGDTAVIDDGINPMIPVTLTFINATQHDVAIPAGILVTAYDLVITGTGGSSPTGPQTVITALDGRPVIGFGISPTSGFATIPHPGVVVGGGFGTSHFDTITITPVLRPTIGPPGDIPVTGFVISLENAMTVDIPAGLTIGEVYDLILTNPAGENVPLASGKWTATGPPPIVTNVVPSSGANNQTHPGVVVTGSNFTGTTQVNIVGPETKNVPVFVVDSDLQITMTVPTSILPGLYDVRVTGLGGTNPTSAVKWEALLLPPVITSFTIDDGQWSALGIPVDVGLRLEFNGVDSYNSPLQISIADILKGKTIARVIPETPVVSIGGVSYFINIVLPVTGTIIQMTLIEVSTGTEHTEIPFGADWETVLKVILFS